jgi:hypothetical protein
VTARRLIQLGLAYLVVTLAITGAWSLFAPAHFWDTYPGFGLEFVEPLPHYNEHLLNDFGSLYLALAALLAVAAVRPGRLLVRASMTAFLVYAVPHFVFHATHLAPFDSAEVVAQIVLLGSFVVVPAALLLLTRRAGATDADGLHTRRTG